MVFFLNNHRNYAHEEILNMRCRQWKSPHIATLHSATVQVLLPSLLSGICRARPCSSCPVFEAALHLLSQDVTAERCWSKWENPSAPEAGTDPMEMVSPKVRGGVFCLTRIREPEESGGWKLCSQHHPVSLTLHSFYILKLLSSKCMGRIEDYLTKE